MEKDTCKTDVIFRKYIDGQIIALMPHNVNDCFGNVESYMHIGQHSGADYGGVLSCTKPAKENEYLDLKNEMENHFGYNLNIVKKQNRNKYINSLNKTRKEHSKPASFYIK